MSVANGKHNLRVERGGKATEPQLPPQHLEYEQAVLGAAIISTDVARRLAVLVSSDDFYMAAHRIIYAAICDLAEQGKPVDVLTVPQHLRDADMLDRVGGMAYISQLTDSLPTAKHVEYYADKVREASALRQLEHFSDRYHIRANEGGADPLELVAQMDEELAKIRRMAMRGQAKLAPMTYSELMASNFPAPEYLIDKFIPTGCTLAHSVPKEGKTRLFTELAIAATTGGKFMGVFDVRETGALCLFLEDSQPETQQRFLALTEQGPLPKNLHVAWDWDTMDRGGLERLDQFFAEHPEVRLLIVDTLEYIRPPIQKDGQLYSQDVAALRKLKDLADKYAPCYVIILHHSNKSKEHSDDVILSAGGTNGIAGSCDTIMQLQGKPDGTKVLRGKGRRIPPFAHVTKMDERAGYQYLGEAETVNRSGEERDLLEALCASQWAMTEVQIAQELGVKRESVRSRCRRAAERKLVKRTGSAQWDITPEGRQAFAEMNAAEITGDRPDRADRPVLPNQAEPPDRDRIDEGEGVPLPDPPGYPGQDGYSGQDGLFGQSGQVGHPSSTPQSAPVFLPDLVFAIGMEQEERNIRQTTWRLAMAKGMPRLREPIQTTGGEGWYRTLCTDAAPADVRAVLRVLEGIG
jgi:hypothetical protein